MFSICNVFIWFCNHSSRSRTERDQFVFGCFTVWSTFADSRMEVSRYWSSSSPQTLFSLQCIQQYQAKVVLVVFWVNCRLYSLLVLEECGIESKLAISDSKCASFVEANNSTVKSKDSLYFQTSYLPIQPNNWFKICGPINCEIKGLVVLEFS